ncbi:DUF2231 domain-containing protein [Rhodococcus gordoniae]|uniref:DUF2231 domain-containing protein n=1 Tax=Rhodococcus gordoniae TaxID=223392 RepID=UPI0020CE5FD3|nr:DUF2231 domain-containing protein [Rhodococcus gordoniae]UTT48935.1 DUF2231 domain-containing protein [Rhodococcus gordoniae]
MNLHELLRAVESFDAVDRPAERIAQRIRRVLDGSVVDDLLRGSWLGHPVHPLLVTVPIGSWISAAVLDALSGQRDASRKLVALGLAAAVPTVITGYADFSTLDVPQRRVGAVHAVSNAIGAICMATSYRARRARHDRTGTVWTLVGLGAVSVGGALGGHLSYAQGGGVYRWQRPSESVDLAAELEDIGAKR